MPPADRGAGPARFAAVCPGPPDWHLPWADVLAAFAWVRRLVGVPQDPAHHAEGDVATHTRMAAQALAGLPAWRELPEPRRVLLFAAVLLHDVGKAGCTRVDVDGWITSAGHALRGELAARRLLWELDTPAAWREHVATLVGHHQVPLWAMDRPDLERVVLRVSLLAGNRDLALLAAADVAGRRSAGAPALAEQVALFEEYCAELGVTDRPWRFASDHARFTYFRIGGRDPRYAPFDDTTATVTVLAGLPAAGKDTWIAGHRPGLPVVSLDALRAELRVAPTADQRPVVAAAYDRAVAHLRAGRPFVWNATNVTRQLRQRCVDLAARYRARVEIVSVEAPPDVIMKRNRDRQRPVPEAVIDRLAGRWQPPDLTEAHAVHRVDTR